MTDPWQSFRRPMAQPSQPNWLQRNQDALMNAGIGLLTGPTAQQQLALGGRGLLQGRQQDRDRARTAQERNKTVAYLQRINPQLAQMVEGGLPVGQAWKTHLQAQTAETMNPYANGNAQRFNDQAGEWTQPPRMKSQAIDTDDGQWSRDIRGDHFGDDDVNAHGEVGNAHGRVRALAQADRGAGDLGLIFNHMKMLDPASVVREGEFATAENAGGVSTGVRSLYNRIVDGERLTPELRREFVTAADTLHAETAGNRSAVTETDQRVGDDWQVDADGFIVQAEPHQRLRIGQTRTLPGQAGQITIKRVR